MLSVLCYEVHLLENMSTECFICISAGTKDSTDVAVSLLFVCGQCTVQRAAGIPANVACNKLLIR